jgi:2-succinyl-5-enolpyruvyl-6-hydroxy-3-cyclohexene-1-carboxylate synthase
MDITGSNPARMAITTCIALGVREFIVCSGTRNAALLACISSIPEVSIYNHPEERSAAFFALGRARKSQLPVAVVTTSGTAASELLSAAIEAYYQAVPLVFLTADRPLRFRGKGAPQAIDQPGLYGDYVNDSICDWKQDRPLHINIPLEEPAAEDLAKIQSWDSIATMEPDTCNQVETDTLVLQDFLQGNADILVVLGCLPASWRAPVKEFLLRLKAPVIAEATSGLREDFPQVFSKKAAGIVLRIGGVPTCRLWRELEANEKIPVFSVTPNGLPGLSRQAGVIRSAKWSAISIPEDVQTIPTVDESPDALLSQYSLSEPAWIRRISEIIPKGSLVFLGNSQPVREWNLAASRRQLGLQCFANRGANGIEGNISTFLGLSEDEGEAWALVGDLTAIYDLASPWILNQLSGANRRIVIINNGGGRIFRRLSALEGFSAAQMNLVENPHSLNFGGWAAMWNIPYRKVIDPSDLVDLPDGALIIELIPDSDQSEGFWKHWESI